MSFKIKLLSAFLTLGVLPFLIISAMSIMIMQDTISKQVFSHLETVLIIKKNQIEKYFVTIKNTVHVIKDNPAIESALRNFERSFVTEGRKTGGVQWRKVEEQYRPVFHDIKKDFGYYDILLISANGNIVYSVAQESDLGENLLEGRLKDTNLARAFRGLRNEDIITRDFEPYISSGNKPAAFLAGRINDSNDKFIGAVAIQIPLDQIDEIMQERSGMGETGETYLVGPDNLMRSNSYLDPSTRSVVASFANPSSGRVVTDATREALAGKTGSSIIVDYRDTRVLSAYAPVNAGNLNWALMVEIDEAEAFSSVKLIGWIIFIVFFIGTLVIVASSVFLAKSISKPISILHEKIVKLGQGDLDIKVEINSNDEIGRLAKAFNTMISETKKSRSEIKQLRGILPICSFCKKVRDDQGYWEQVDVYIYNHSEAEISHGICPECEMKQYPKS